jgi:hypothetical protein
VLSKNALLVVAPEQPRTRHSYGPRPRYEDRNRLAAETIEEAEIIFANEMGATLDLSPAAKVALILKIAAAIQAAVADERARLTCAQQSLHSYAE